MPLSLVGTLAVMYLAGFSLNNLSIMALTIATGFVVDDAIVMIENIARYIERGDDPQDGGAQGLAADRLHRRLAHRVADRRADPAALHGRRGRPPVQRVRRHALRHHPDLGRGVAHPGADDVRPAPAQRPAAATAAPRRRAAERPCRGAGAGRALVRPADRLLRPLPDRGVPPPGAHPRWSRSARSC